MPSRYSLLITHYLLPITYYYTIPLEDIKLNPRFGKLKKEALLSVGV